MSIQKKIADILLLIPSDQQQFARKRIDALVREVNTNPIPQLCWRTINGEVESLNEQKVNKFVNTICNLTHSTWEDMQGRSRVREINDIRQTAMWIVRKGTSLSFADVGKVFNRHHATVLHAVENVENLIQTDAMYRAHVDQIINHLDSEPLVKAFDKLT